MTQRFGEHGVTPVTVVTAGPCTVTQVKGDKDGYHAVQVGFDPARKARSKPLTGHLKGLGNFRYLREFRTEAAAQPGQTFSVSVFKPGDIVKVTGTSKGKGFQGVVKRHHFHGSPKSHGHKDQLRMPGSIGATEPQHVFKGTRMAGRMGGEQVTVSNLEIVDVDEKQNLLFIKGAIPGPANGLLAISGDGEMVFIDAGTKEENEEASPQAEAKEVPATEKHTEEPIEAKEKVEVKAAPEKKVEEQEQETSEAPASEADSDKKE